MTIEACTIEFTGREATRASRESEQAADQLGRLLFDTPELQTYLRRLRAARHDTAALTLQAQIREIQYSYDPDQPALDDLLAQYEALPAVRALREAERAARRLFAAVDDIVSAAAQAPFAPYARAGCG